MSLTFGTRSAGSLPMDEMFALRKEPMHAVRGACSSITALQIRQGLRPHTVVGPWKTLLSVRTALAMNSLAGHPGSRRFTRVRYSEFSRGLGAADCKTLWFLEGEG